MSMPDLKEITGMAGKLFGDIKKSVTQIADDYKKNHPAPPKPVATACTPAPKVDTVVSVTPVVTPSETTTTTTTETK